MLTKFTTEVKQNERSGSQHGHPEHRPDFDHRKGRGTRDRILPRRAWTAAALYRAQHGFLRLRRRAADAGDGLFRGIRSSELDPLFPRVRYQRGTSTAGGAGRGHHLATAVDRPHAHARFVDDRVSRQRREHPPVNERSAAVRVTGGMPAGPLADFVAPGATNSLSFSQYVRPFPEQANLSDGGFFPCANYWCSRASCLARRLVPLASAEARNAGPSKTARMRPRVRWTSATSRQKLYWNWSNSKSRNFQATM